MQTTKTTDERVSAPWGLTDIEYAKLAIECIAQAGMPLLQLNKIRAQLEQLVDASLD